MKRLTEYGMRREVLKTLGIVASDPSSSIALKHISELNALEMRGLHRFLRTANAANKRQMGGIITYWCDLSQEDGIRRYLLFHGLFIRMFELYGKNSENIGWVAPHSTPDHPLETGIKLVEGVGVEKEISVSRQIAMLRERGALSLAAENPEHLDKIIELLNKYPDRHLDSSMLEVHIALIDGCL